MTAGQLFEHPTLTELRAAETRWRELKAEAAEARREADRLALAALKAEQPAELVAEILGRPVDYVKTMPKHARWRAQEEARWAKWRADREARAAAVPDTTGGRR